LRRLDQFESVEGMVGRIPVMNVTPVVDPSTNTLGQPSTLAAKGTVGEPFPVTASVFREGHDKLGAEVVLIDPKGKKHPPVAMLKDAHVPDKYAAWVTPDAPGLWHFEIQSWSDTVGTWQHAAGLKIPAGVDVDLMFTEGRLVLERVLKGLPRGHKKGPDADVLKAAIATAKDTKRPAEAKLAALQAPELAAVLAKYPLRDLLTTAGPYPVYADRQRALYGSWYEFFPRSEGATLDEVTGKVTSGTFRTAAKRLDAVAAMGFDIIYMPPIHPIGEVNRKGPNNTLTPGPDDTGSPWAIGSKHGGHDAIHPDLGTFDDFDAFVARAGELGLEVAMDLALQAAPDHPWATEHPEFFTTRADGTIAYAENPPKKYQDIYPINFDNDYPAFYAEVLRIVKLWMSHGVRVFRVDNPHTKTLGFWEELLREIRRTDPDVIFLSEAFTRPAMMHGLGAIGYHQSYTYFTWRTQKWEIEQYLHEVSRVSSHLMRPNFFVNTPDILHAFLQYGGPPAFKIRAVLAAMGSPSWGVYAGYELFEHVAVKPGSEEYLDTEKFQIRVRDWDAATAAGRTLAPYLTELNRIRREHPSLQLLRNLTIHKSDDDHVLVFSKTAHDAEFGDPGDTVLIVLNLDPHGTRETTIHLDMPALGMAWDASFVAEDELSGQKFTWWEHNYVRLDPHHEPAHILTVRRAG
jgi:starch synthase (maltosyl-transferring)